jgi:type IV pilus assembly protein PilV
MLSGCRRTPIKDQRGSFIIEAMVSLLIFSVALIALIGLATQALGQMGQIKSRNDASYLASELIGDMWVTATPATYDIVAWRSTTRVADGLVKLGNGLVKISGAEFPAMTGSDTEPCTTPSSITGTQVFICISWADSKNAGVRHFYKTATEIVKN